MRLPSHLLAFGSRLRRLPALLGQRTVRTALLMALLLGAVFASSAVYLARLQTLDEYRSIAHNLAEYAAQRTLRIREYTYQAFQALEDNATQDPCSASAIDLMRRLSYGNDLVVDMGYVQDGRLICSSIGRLTPGIDVGAVDAVSATGAQLRMQVTLPFAHGKRYLLSTFHGYTAIMNAGWSQDVQGWMPDASAAIGMFHPEAKKIMFARGQVRTDLLEQQVSAHPPWDRTPFIVALHPTGLGYTGFALIPIQALEGRWHAKALQALPVGLLIGVLLAALVSWVTWRQSSMPAMIRSALQGNEFSMVYQPVVDLATGQWRGLEALMRWTRPDGRQFPPDVFIAVAERSGQIRALTQWMVRTVLAETHELLRSHPGFHVAINLSSDDVSDGALLQHLHAEFERYQLPPSALIGEITERVFMDVTQTGAQVHEMRRLGIGIAIDDFGTGYSSLSYLAQLEMDFLKIDKIFVSSIGTGAVTANVVSHIISLAQSLNLHMVAEGVETQQQADWLRERGVQLAQGWLFAKPMPLRDIQQKIAEKTA